MRYASNIFFVLAAALLVLAVPARGQSSTSYVITSSALAGGGGGASSSTYAVNGTAGQAATGAPTSSSYRAEEGYWYTVGGGALSLIFANVKALLEGPYAGSGSMNTDLNSNGVIPTNQPYSDSKYEGTPLDYEGNESVSTIPSGVVDWVLVELRTSTAASDSVDTRAAFIKSDGSIVDTDGSSQVSFSGLAPGSYYVVVHQRNHLSVMSASTVSVSGGASPLYDFTSAQSQTYNDGAVDLGSGVWGLYAGNGNGDAQVLNDDKNGVWAPQVGGSGYLRGDFGMDTQVLNDDKNALWAPNVGTSSTVPE